MDERTQFFVLIYFDEFTGRMKNCQHMHDTLSQAQACAKAKVGEMAIAEWNKDRIPQFTRHPMGSA